MRCFGIPTKSTSGQKRPSRLRCSITCLCFATSTAFLVLALILQAILLIRGSWEIPEPLLAQVHQKLDEQGWEISYHTLDFHFPARLTISQAALSRKGEEEILARAELGQINFSVRQLLRGKLKITKADVDGGVIFCPGAYSPTGASEAVLKRLHVSFGQGTHGWRIHSLNGKIHNLTFTASGVLPDLTPEQETEPVNWNAILATVLPRIIRERENFHRAENPGVRVRLLPAGPTGLTVEAEAWADKVDAPHQVEIYRPHLTSAWHFDGADWRGDRASFEASYAEWDSQLRAQSIFGEVHWANPSSDKLLFDSPDAGHLSTWIEALLPQRASISVADVSGPPGSLTGIQTNMTLTGPEEVEIQLFTFFQDDPLEATGHLHWGTGDGQLDIVSQVNPTPLLQHEIVRALGLPYDLSFGEAPFARATGKLEGWKLAGASGRANARYANIDGVFLHQASAQAHLVDNRFIVPEMVLTYGDFQTLGFYEVDRESRGYRLLFTGDVRPLHISGWFREWWVNFWEEFDFPNSPLAGDVDINGRHGHSEEVTVFGSVQAKDFFLRGVEFESIDARLDIRRDFIDLFDIEVQRAEGGARGSFQYHINPVTRAMEQLDFDAHSTLDPVEVAAIFGPAGEDAVSPFRFTQSPALLLSGTVYGPSGGGTNRVKLTGGSAAPLTYNGLELDHLKLDALMEGADWNFQRIEAGVAGGEVTGDGRKWLDEDEDQLEFALLMVGLDMSRGLQAISSWREQLGLEESANTPNDMAGTLGMMIQASGPLNDFQSFSGEGNLRITEADLGEIHLLGILSRILNLTPLGFTSLQFNEADATFLLDRQDIHFSSLRLSGPTSEINATGQYDLGDDSLDFALKVRLMRESRIPLLSLILSPVLEPLAHVLEVRLTGTSTDPQWRFLLGPRNILSGISGEGTRSTETEE